MTSAGNSVNMKYVFLDKLDKAVYSSFPTFITDNYREVINFLSQLYNSTSDIAAHSLQAFEPYTKTSP